MVALGFELAGVEGGQRSELAGDGGRLYRSVVAGRRRRGRASYWRTGAFREEMVASGHLVIPHPLSQHPPRIFRLWRPAIRCS